MSGLLDAYRTAHLTVAWRSSTGPCWPPHPGGPALDRSRAGTVVWWTCGHSRVHSRRRACCPPTAEPPWLCCLSFDEGFGLPALEAMALGIPVVAASRGALPEVVGEAGLFVDPTDSGDIANAFHRVLTEPAVGRVCRERGLAQAAGVQLDRVGKGAPAALQVGDDQAVVEAPGDAPIMRIGIDVRELLGRPTGVGRYLSSLLGQWAESARRGTFSHQMVLYAPEKCRPEVAARFDPLQPRVSGGVRLLRDMVGTGASASDRVARRPRRLLLTGVYVANQDGLSDRSDRPRCVVSRAPGVVCGSRAPPAILAHHDFGASREDRPDRLSFLR